MPYKTLEDRREAYKRHKVRIQAANKKWQQANKEHLNKYARAKYQNNKEKYRIRARAYYEKNKERILALNKTWREENIEKARESGNNWKKKNKESLKEKAKEYKQANKDKVNVINAKRRALKFRATIRLTELDKFVIEEMYNLAKIRTEQTGFSWHVDHIKPLTKGGLHKPTNLQVVPGSWNIAKGNRSEDKWT